MKSVKPGGWLPALLVQILIMGLMCALLLLLSLLMPAEAASIVYAISMWALVPLIALGSSMLAARKGLYYWVAWIAPFLVQMLVHFIMTGMPPSSPGMVMVTILLSIFGAAAGEEMNKRSARNRRSK